MSLLMTGTTTARSCVDGSPFSSVNPHPDTKALAPTGSGSSAGAKGIGAMALEIVKGNANRRTDMSLTTVALSNSGCW